MSKKTKKTLNTLKAKRSQYRAGGIGRTEAAKEAGRSGRNPMSEERNLLKKAKDKVVNEMTKNKGENRKQNKTIQTPYSSEGLSTSKSKEGVTGFMAEDSIKDRMTTRGEATSEVTRKKMADEGLEIPKNPKPAKKATTKPAAPKANTTQQTRAQQSSFNPGNLTPPAGHQRNPNWTPDGRNGPFFIVLPIIDDGDNNNKDENGFDTGPLNVENKKLADVELDQMVTDPIVRTNTETVDADIQQLDDAGTVTTGGVDAPTMEAAAQGDVTKGVLPPELEAATYEASMAGDLADTEAAQGEVSAIARAEGATLTERARAADRDTGQEQAAKQDSARMLRAQSAAYVPAVTGEAADVNATPEAEAAQREAITGTKADDKRATQIINTVGFEAAQRRTVTGTAAKGTAAKMLEVVGELPPAITAAIVEDPATVTAQIDSEPVEVRAAVAALPTEALVSSQMESLLGGMEDGEVPMWARPAVQSVNDMLVRRGMSASSVGRDALFNSIIQSAMPMAQSNAQALQATAAQNLSNQQQANMSQATLDMQRRMANLSNEQASESQTAQMAQQMSAMQSQFRQDAVMTTAQLQQQTRTQNLANRQQAAQTDAQNAQAMAAQNLGNEQQIELANMQYQNATESENMSAIQQERMAEMQVGADFLAKNAAFKQQMDLANLGNDQQMRLANLSALNQADSESMSAEQQTELANLNTKMQTNLTQAKIAESMGLAQLNVNQQRAVQNASMVANIDLTQFSADQQVALTNSKFMQSMTMADFNAEQQAAMQNATSLASMDMANADQRTKLAITNAQSFLSMDMANLNNRQQATVLDQQMTQQRLLSDQAAANAAKQFNATSENQTNQFNNSLAATMSQFNAAQSNAMEQFNTQETNRQAAVEAGNQLQADSITAQLDLDVQKFNEQTDLQRDQWNATNAQAIEQSNVQWRRQANTADTAAANAANQQNVQNAYNISALDQTQMWQQLRDEAAYVRQAYENNEQREAQLIATAIGNESGAAKGAVTSTGSLIALIKPYI